MNAVCSGVQRFTRSGVVTDSGSVHDGDVVICATGFNTSYISRYPIYGPSARNVQDEWAESIMGYMGVGISEFPNTFTSKSRNNKDRHLFQTRRLGCITWACMDGINKFAVLGPYTPVSNGPTLVAIEAQTDYICSFIDRYQTDAALNSFHVKADVCADFKTHVAEFMNNKAVWTDGCRNSHNNHSIGARVPTTWPGSTLHYLEALREVRWEDWEWKYAANRFGFLGNGISQTEWDPTADLGYYIKQNDDDGVMSSRWKRCQAKNLSGSMPPRQLHRQPKLRGGEEEALAVTVQAAAESS